MKGIQILLIIGMCIGLSLEAGHYCKCKTKTPTEQTADNGCTVSTIYWSPDKNYAFNDKIKRAPNGDRV